ncbi:MAG: hypothetical protein MI923_03695, partial [Phycisphaerales bacterium]|nr:hypothetical protein [Phycisphaerales bacterium]
MKRGPWIDETSPAQSSLPARISPQRMAALAPMDANGSGGRRLGAGSDSMAESDADSWPQISSAISLPESVPAAVPRPFWQQALKRPGSSSPKAGAVFRLRHR